MESTSKRTPIPPWGMRANRTQIRRPISQGKTPERSREKHHVRNQEGQVSRVSAARNKISAEERGQVARSSRNMARYVDREKRTRDVGGEPPQRTERDHRFKIAQYTRSRYIAGAI